MKPITAYVAITALSRASRGHLPKDYRLSNPPLSLTPRWTNPFKAFSTRRKPSSAPTRIRSVAEETKQERSFPLGATSSANGTNFCVYSKHATGIELLLFDCADDARPKRVISIDPGINRTFPYWHIFVPGVKAR